MLRDLRAVMVLPMTCAAIVAMLLLRPARILRADEPPAPGPSIELVDPPVRVATPGANILSFSSDASSLLVAGEREARVWDVRRSAWAGAPIKYQEELVTAALSSNGKTVLTAAGRWARVWDARSGEQLQQLELPGIINVAVLSSDGAQVITSDTSEPAAHVWDVATGRKLVSLNHKGEVRFAQLCSGAMAGNLLTVERLPGGRDGSAVSLWNLRSGDRRWWLGGEVNDDNWRSPASVSADGRFVAVVQGGVITLHAGDTGEHIAELEGFARALHFSPRGSHLLGIFLRVGLVEVKRGVTDEEWLLLEDLESATHAAFSPDGRWVLAAGEAVAGIWDASSGKRATELAVEGGSVSAAAFAPDGRHVAILRSGHGGMSAGLSLWSVRQ